MFARVAVLGLGLLGGSVALAVRRADFGAAIVGSTRNPAVQDEALEHGVIDEAGSFEEVVVGADLVVLATTVAAMPEVLRRAAPNLSAGAIVTDVGSVKGLVAETLPGLLPPSAVFVGSHPMAGSHESGLGAARADLFDGAPCVVTDALDSAAAGRVVAFWEALGSRVLRRSPADHDSEVAWVSHVPHVVAWAFAKAFEAAPVGAREVAGSGFRDFTRIARSNPELWGDILTANRKSISAPLEAVGEALVQIARAIEANDAERVGDLIASAKEILEADSPPEEQP